MTERVLGDRGSKRRRYTLLPIVAITSLLALFWIAGAQGVHSGPSGDNLFELGAANDCTTAPETGGGVTNILSCSPVAPGTSPNGGPDWADVPTGQGLFDATSATTGNAVNLFGGAAARFIKDDTSAKGAVDRTTFSGAGTSNKNNDPLSGPETVTGTDCQVRGLTGSNCNPWHWDSGNVPPKDDLTNLYSYATFVDACKVRAVTCTPTDSSDDHLIIYAALERGDPSGDSHIDIEYLQSEVALKDGAVTGPSGIPCNDPGNDPTPCDFTGIRTIGDVVVSMDFEQGGAIGSVNIRSWNGTAYSLPLATVIGGGCIGAGGAAGDDICAFNNASPIDGGPWDNFDNHGDEITTLETNAFTEIGADLTALLPAGTSPCLSTFLGKTRSSSSFTAELKDFAGPTSFPICGGHITITPDDTNSVGENHTFAVNLTATIGGTTGPAPDGTSVNVTLTNTLGAVNSISSNTCNTGAIDPGTGVNGVGTVNGLCSVTFTSPTAGTVTGHASATLQGQTFQTDGTGNNSDDAVKQFIAGSLAWVKRDNAGALQGGATFTVCRTHNLNTSTDPDTFDLITAPGVCVEVVDDVLAPVDTPTTAKDQNAAAGRFSLTGLRLGRYTVKELTAPPGFVPDPDTETVDLTLALPNGTITTDFVNQRPILKLTEFGYTNAPTGTPTAGVVSGTTTYTVKVKNFGGASVSLSGQLAVSKTGGGTLSCTDGNTKSLSATLDAAGGTTVEATFTLACTYTTLDDGAVVTANLQGAGGTGGVTYTTNGTTRTASGTPATISFTVQSD